MGVYAICIYYKKLLGRIKVYYIAHIITRVVDIRRTVNLKTVIYVQCIT